MYKLLNDISTLTTAPQLYLNKFADIGEDCICDYVLKTIKDGQEVCSIDIGIGALHLLVVDGCVKYKFIPSVSLSKGLCDTIQSEKSPLEDRVEQAISDKINWVIKELL